MTREAAITLMILSLALYPVGFLLMYMSRRGESPGDPIRTTWNWRKWKPIWTMRRHFATERAFRIYFAGVTCLSVAALIGLIVMYARP